MTQHPIAAFLHARYSEIEEKARAAIDQPDDGTWTSDESGNVFGKTMASYADNHGQHHGTHIAAHDPAYVLADIAAKRLIVEDFRWWWDHPGQPSTDAELHARCSHPEWGYATTEGPRKAWDDADVPPAGDGWERNIEVGWNGWERYNHFEESYWRRRRTPEDAELRRAKAGRPPLVLRALALPFAQHPDHQESWKP